MGKRDATAPYVRACDNYLSKGCRPVSEVTTHPDRARPCVVFAWHLQQGRERAPRRCRPQSSRFSLLPVPFKGLQQFSSAGRRSRRTLQAVCRIGTEQCFGTVLLCSEPMEGQAN